MTKKATAKSAPVEAKPSQPRVGGRSARIVAEVLNATVEELARIGYAALRMEEVAHLAGVNKTTVYRRWPTKVQLVTEALQRERDRCIVTPDAGSVREDFRIMLNAFVEEGQTPMARAWLSEMGNPEVRTIMNGFRHHFEAQWAAVIARGMARGELPPDTSPLFLLEVLVAPVLLRLVRGEELPDEAFCGQVLDLVLAGADARNGRDTRAVRPRKAGS